MSAYSLASWLADCCWLLLLADSQIDLTLKNCCVSWLCVGVWAAWHRNYTWLLFLLLYSMIFITQIWLHCATVLLFGEILTNLCRRLSVHPPPPPPPEWYIKSWSIVNITVIWWCVSVCAWWCYPSKGGKLVCHDSDFFTELYLLTHSIPVFVHDTETVDTRVTQHTQSFVIFIDTMSYCGGGAKAVYSGIRDSATGYTWKNSMRRAGSH